MSIGYAYFFMFHADCIFGWTLLSEFKLDLEDGKDWIQCRYDVRNPEASEQTRLLTYALSLFNGVWLWGQDSLGMGCALRGNGMCFREDALRRFPWKAYGLTEDLEFSWLLRLAREQVFFNPNTAVYGEMVSGKGIVAENQRKRWEEGRKSLRRMFYLHIWRSKHLSVPLKILCAIDLFSLPLARLFFLVIGGALLNVFSLIIVSFAASDLSSSTSALFSFYPSLTFSLANALFLICYLISPFILFSFPLSYLKTLFKAPGYILWKAMIALRRIARKKEQNGNEWIRTEREKR